jgi:glutamyl-tRNA reductase
VISSSAAPGFLISPGEVRQALASRDGRPLLLIDIAVPRDIDPEVRGLPRVHLYDIDDLQAAVEENLNSRRQEVAKVERIIDEGLARFTVWLRERGVVPTVAALRERADTCARPSWNAPCAACRTSPRRSALPSRRWPTRS